MVITSLVQQSCQCKYDPSHTPVSLKLVEQLDSFPIEAGQVVKNLHQVLEAPAANIDLLSQAGAEANKSHQHCDVLHSLHVVYLFGDFVTVTDQIMQDLAILDLSLPEILARVGHHL